uniref:RNase H-like protein n=1 Tax=Saccharum officinarum TaxID=4547 RepID=Q6XNL2_SACOF|nr:RNase H-like protein [Saccharum hybrid cultivar CP65-357]
MKNMAASYSQDAQLDLVLPDAPVDASASRSEHSSQLASSNWRSVIQNSPPDLLCGCGRPAIRRTAETAKNNGRIFRTCPACKIWIWQDLLDSYVNALISYCRDASIDSLQSELESSRLLISEKQAQISRLEKQLETLQPLISKYTEQSRSIAQASIPSSLFFLEACSLRHQRRRVNENQGGANFKRSYWSD